MSKPITTSYQPSMTEWFAAIGEIGESNAFREEDNRKSDRLEVLYQVIGLAYERPIKFQARDLIDKTPAFQKILKNRGNKHCAIRLVPKKQHLPKFRNRGMLLADCYNDWFLKQDINHDDYDALIHPHSETLSWSIIFIVAKNMIFGEIIRGLHSQLTHGDTENPPYQFSYDFKKWHWSNKDKKTVREIKRMIKMVFINKQTIKNKLAGLLKAKFSHNYLMGYFEAVIWPDDKIYFIDYNRLLPKYISEYTPVSSASPVRKNSKSGGNKNNFVSGVSAYGGLARGKIIKVSHTSIGKIKFSRGQILVCDNTDVRYLPIMKKAAAIVTDRGGILSHASIIARELKKPCIIGTKIATKVLKDGDSVEVDANKGVVRILKKALKF